MSDAPTLTLMCGLPAAGKTTVARELAATRRAVRMSPDEWLVGLGIGLWDEEARARMERLLWEHAVALLRIGASVILESGFWTRVERDETRVAAHALGAVVELVFVQVPVDELWRRLERRNAALPPGERRFTRRELEEWAALFESPTEAERALFTSQPSRRSSRP